MVEFSITYEIKICGVNKQFNVSASTTKAIEKPCFVLDYKCSRFSP